MYLGVDIGGTKCAVLAADESGKIREKIRFETESPAKTQKRIIEALRTLAAGGSVDAVGISCGGPLDSQKGVILSPPNLPGWDCVPITDMVSEAVGAPAFLSNDANACALAEWRFGAGQGCQSMIFLTFGTGLGAGLILDGRLYEGVNGMAGEAGHIRLSAFGPVGYGRMGSFEGFCSGAGLAQLGKMMATEALQQGNPPSFCPTAEALSSITAKSLAEAADAGDALARRVYEISGEKLGEGLAVLADLFNPECIVIGSVFARSEALLRPAMERTLKENALPAAYSALTVKAAALGDAIGDVAAVAVAMNGKENRNGK